MVGFRTIFIVKMMTFWNFISSFFGNMKNEIMNFYDHIRNYFYGYHDMWVFVPGHTAPISLNNLYNSIYASWVYDNFKNTLSIFSNSDTEITNCKFSWLSAKIRIFNNPKSGFEYNIDDFIENFRLETVDNIVPSLYMIFMCWCASTKHWFSPDDIIEFHIIDDMGEDIILNLDEHNESLFIKHNKISVIIHSEEDNQIINQETNNTEEIEIDEAHLNEESKTKED